MKKPSKLKMARIEAGLTQKELAEKCGINCSTISRAEHAMKKPSGYNIIQICKVLGKTLDELFGEE